VQNRGKGGLGFAHIYQSVARSFQNAGIDRLLNALNSFLKENAPASEGATPLLGHNIEKLQFFKFSKKTCWLDIQPAVLPAF
jgi:hypothetical protein